MKFNHNFQSKFRILSKGRVVLAVSVLASTILNAELAQNALPANPTIVSGNIGISSSAPNNLTVNQSTNKGIINWDSFDIGSNANVRFNQPNVNSSTLNRVVGSNLSQISGTLSANGKVILINPNGVIFSKGSRVDVGGIVASTLDLSDENYLNDKYVFSRNGSKGKVLNYGDIIAQDKGFVALLAPEVINEGVVIARAGSIAFAAGDKVSLDFGGDGLLQVEVESSTIDSLIENKNLVIADSGIVYMSTKAASDLQSSVISNAGTIQANSIQEVGGKIILTGDDITLTSTSNIEAVGAKGGGEVLVGGDWQGSNDVYQATTVTMEKGSTIDASATQNGDGGKVVLWSDITNEDSVTTVEGTILAKAGESSGDGGNIETSGSKVDFDNAIINASSQLGNSGLWLIDPDMPEITVAGASSIASNLNSQDIEYYDTTGDLTLQNNAKIEYTGSSNRTLTLKTPNTIKFGSGSSITSTSGKLNIILWASYNKNRGGTIKIGVGESDTVTLNSNGGDITVGGGVNLSDGYAYGASSGVYITKNANIDAAGGNIVIRGQADADDKRGIYQWGTVKTNGTGTISYYGTNSGNDDNGNGIWLRNALIQSQNGDIYLYANGADHSNPKDLLLDGDSTIQTTGSGNITVDIDRDISVLGNINFIDFNSTSTVMKSLGGGNITLNNIEEIELDGTIQTSGIFTLNASSFINSLEIGSGVDGDSSKLTFPISYFTSKLSDGFEQIVINTFDSINVTGTLEVNDPLFLNAGLTSISLGGDINTNNNNLILRSTDTSTIGQQLNLGTGNLELRGNFNLTTVQRNYTGDTYIWGGTVSQTNNYALPLSTALTMGSNSTLDLNNYNIQLGSLQNTSSNQEIKMTGNLRLLNNTSASYSGVINGSGDIIIDGSETFTLSGNNSSYSGDIAVNDGTLVVKSNNALGNSTGDVTVESGATLDLRADVGSESIILNGGTLSTSTGLASSSGPITLNANNSIIDVSGQLSLSGVMDDGANSYNIIKNGAGTLALSGANTYGGSTTVSSGTLKLDASNAVPDTSSVTLSSGTTFDLNDYSDTIASVAGAGNISLGSGTLTTGDTTNTTLSGIISETGNLVKNGSGKFTLSGNNTYTGTTTINGGTLQIGAGGATGALSTGNIILNNGSELLFNRTGTLAVTNTVSGTGNIVKNGASTLTLSGNNTFSGFTNVYDGTLILTHNNALGNSANTASIFSGATLDLQDVNIGIDKIYLYQNSLLTTSTGTSSFSGTTNLNASVANKNVINVANNAQLTLSGKVDNFQGREGVGIEKTGAGTLVLTSDLNDYETDLISEGTLQIGDGGTTGKAGTGVAYSLVNNSHFYINRSNDVSLSSIVGNAGVEGTGTMTAHVGGNLTVDRNINLSGANSDIILTAGYNIAAGTETDGDVTLTNTVKTSNSATVTIFSGNADTSALNSKITGAIGSTKYKTYNVDNSAMSGAVSGTRNFYYREDPKLTINGLTASKTYDGNTNAITSLSGGTITGNIDGDSVYSMSNLNLVSALYGNKNAGSRTLTANYTVKDRTANNYKVSGYTANQFSQTNAGTIDKKTVTLSGAKTYDGDKTLTIGEVLLGGFIGTETLSYSGATVNDAHVSTANKYIDAITLQNGSNGGLASNYQIPTLNSTNAAVTINAKILTPTLSNTGVTKVYDGNTSSSITPTYTYSGFVTGDSDAVLNNTSIVYNSSHVASANKVTVSGLSIDSITSTILSLGSDYVLDATSKEVSASITPVTLTTTLTNTGITKIYDGTTSAPISFIPTYSITGFVGDDTSATINNTNSLYNDAHVVNANKITVSGLSIASTNGSSNASDYVLDASSKEVNASINKKALTPRITSLATKTYDGTTDALTALTYVYTPQNPGDDFEGRLVGGDSDATLTHTSYVYNSKDVTTADKVIVSGLAIDSITGNKDSLASDYYLTTTTLEQVGVITEKEVSLAASKVYDANTTLSGPDVTILTGVGSETLAYSGAIADSAHVSSNASNYITSITLENNATVLASNYKLPTLNHTNAPVTITPASLTAILNNSGVTKVYDGTTSTGITPTYNITGFVSGDSDASISSVSQAYDDAHVLTASKVSVFGMDITAITGGNSSEVTDYVLSSNSSETSATITPATLTPTISNTVVSKVYDGTTSSIITPNYTYAGLVSGDTDATLSHTTTLYDDKDVLDASKVTVSGLDIIGITGDKSSVASDYVLDNTSKDVNASITKRTVALAASKVYDGNTILSGPDVTILTGVGSETLTYTAASANDANVLSANKYINAITLLNGANGGLVSNYKLPTLNNIFAPATITPASLIISANSHNKAYDAIPYFGGQGVIYSGFVGGENPSILSGTLAYNGDSQGAINSGVYDITPYGLSNSNYAITFVNGNLSIDPQKVIPIPTVPVPVPPPPPPSTDVSNPAPASNPIPTAPANTNNADINIQETASNSTVSFDGLVVGRTQAGDEVKAIIIEGAASSKVPFTLLVNVKAEEAFSFDIPSDIVNQVNKSEVDVSLSDGNKLPSWLSFDENSMSFNSQNVPVGSFPLSVNLKMGTGVNSKTIEVIIK